MDIPKKELLERALLFVEDMYEDAQTRHHDEIMHKIRQIKNLIKRQQIVLKAADGMI